VPPGAQTVRGLDLGSPLGLGLILGLILALAGVLESGCAAGPVPCASPSHCSTGSECLAHRCVPLGSDPVAAGSQRLVLDAEQVAVVQEEGRRTGSGLPPTVTFGGPAATNQELLLRFSRAWAALDIDSAFLLLEPVPDANPSAADVPVRVALAASAWIPGSTAHTPGERGPRSSGLARTRPPRVLVVDVTAQLQALQAQGRGRGRTARSGPERSDHDRSDYGLVVRAEQTSQRGATYQTGSEGVLPRLDVYGRAPPGGAD
jgi:hypothetical protein